MTTVRFRCTSLDNAHCCPHTSPHMVVGVTDPAKFGLLLIAASAIGMYVAARVAFDSLTDPDHPSAARMAFAHWFPIALVALIAVWAGQPAMAVCVTFGTTVAALLLNLGLITATTGAEITVSQHSRAWPLLVPAALLAFVAGFRAELNWMHAAVLLAQGLMISLLWSPTPHEQPQAQTISVRAWLLVILAVIIAAAGAVVGVFGVVRMSVEIPITTPGLIATVGLSPLLVLPMIGTGTLLAERGHCSSAASALVGLSLLNLCLLIPLMIVAWEVRRLTLQYPDGPQHIPFPIGTWRVDTILILTIGVVLVPVAVGRFRFSRAEGVVLVIAYAAYLGATSVLGVRW